eukprot:s4093_g1.t1
MEDWTDCWLVWDFFETPHRKTQPFKRLLVHWRSSSPRCRRATTLCLTAFAFDQQQRIQLTLCSWKFSGMGWNLRH